MAEKAEALSYTAMNPIIGDTLLETLHNLRAIMTLMKVLQSNNEMGGLDLNKLASDGLYLFNTCLLKAVEYEIERAQPING